MPLRYGKQTTITQSGDMVITEESVIANFLNVKKTTVYTESIHVKSDKEVLAEYLKLLDRWKTGDIDLPGIQVFRDKTGNMRVEKSWVVSD